MILMIKPPKKLNLINPTNKHYSKKETGYSYKKSFNDYPEIPLLN